MRVALVSDLHGNTIALDAVLADLRRHAVDRLVCLGDVATLGPDPSGVLARLADLGCTCILGNHDEYLFAPELIHAHTSAPVIVDAVARCREARTTAELAQARAFVKGLDVDLGRGRTLRLFHGSPRSNNEDLLATTSDEELDHALEGALADVMVGGHTHVPLVRNHRGRWLVNPGSVGLPFEAFVGGGPPRILPHAAYAIVTASPSGIEVGLHRVDLDARALHAAAARWDNPLSAMLTAQYA